jgi:hypothetical protein
MKRTARSDAEHEYETDNPPRHPDLDPIRGGRIPEANAPVKAGCYPAFA